MTKYLIKFGGSGTFYTIENGALVNTGEILTRAETFRDYGFDSLSGVGSIISSQTTAATIYAWSNDGIVHQTAELTGLPKPKFIQTDEINLTANNIVAISSIDYTVTGTPCMSVQIDNGDWLGYDGVNWIPTAMTAISYMATVAESVWEDLFDGATTFRLRVWLTADADTISNVTLHFVTN